MFEYIRERSAMGIIKTSKLIFDYIRRDEEENIEEIKRAIDGVSLDIKAGQFVAILGHNGSGKSTFAKQLDAILLPTEGTVWIQGMDTSVEENLWEVRKKTGMVRELNRKEGITVLLITHYMEEVIDADRVIVMDNGKVVMDGAPKEIFSRVEELKSYRLDVPQVTELAYELQKNGVDLPDGILTLEELMENLLPKFAERFPGKVTLGNGVKDGN